MSRVLITVRFHDGRYHGTGDAQPSPARLFQALTAGVGLSGPLGAGESTALKWLEGRKPPLIGSPLFEDGQSVNTYVPNNDLDAVGGDVRRMGKIRAAKSIRPRLFDAEIPLLFAWAFDPDEESQRHAQTICLLAERLYQLGRGADIAWAWGEILDDEELHARLSSYPGLVSHPTDGAASRTLACPEPGSLASLEARHAASGRRFRMEGHGRFTKQLFSQPPQPRFAQVAYESPPSRRVYDLRERSDEAAFGVWPLARAFELVVWIRDAAAQRLHAALPDQRLAIERVLVGRKADGTDGGPTSMRVKIVPLPSIGHYHADFGIRRVLIEVPAGCPVRADDVHWAFSGLDVSDPTTGEVCDLILTASDDKSMLKHYGTPEVVSSRVWRTVTPTALPENAKRRRIEPNRMVAEAKSGAERAGEDSRAAEAVARALRQAGVRTRPEAIRIQREPFEANGERAEAFAPGTRFAKERLRHVELVFNESIGGPLVIGDGRFLGLGIMAPLQPYQGILAFVVDGGLVAAPPASTEVTRSLRRAVMARVQALLGVHVNLPAFFTGHERDGSPAQTESRPHLTFIWHEETARLMVVAPHVVGRRTPTREEAGHLQTLDEALTDLRELRAGSGGRLSLRATSVDLDADTLFTPSRRWESVTPYQVTRHAKRQDAAEALSADIRAECRRRGLPEPQVVPNKPRGVPGLGLVGEAQLTFKVAVKGPIVLGRSRHFGGGLFAARGPGDQVHDEWRVR